MRRRCCLALCLASASPRLVSSSYDCKLDAGLKADLWSADRRDFCCRHEGIGCETVPDERAADVKLVADADVVDVADVADVADVVDVADVADVADVERVADVEQTYDCSKANASSSEAPDDWSELQTSWCCLHEHVACPAEGPLEYPAVFSYTVMAMLVLYLLIMLYVMRTICTAPLPSPEPGDRYPVPESP